MKKMFLVSPFDNPYMNHAIEQVLLEEQLDYDELLLLWVNKPSVIIGRNQNPWKEVHLDKAKSLGVDVLRRCSGGGAVYHDKGNLNYAFITTKSHYDEGKNFQLLIKSLQSFGIKAHIGDRKDLFVQDKKISGSAFYLKKEKRLHHGTLLIDVDLAKLWSVLRFNNSQIESRGVASKRSDVLNLKELNYGVTVQSMVAQLEHDYVSVNTSVIKGDARVLVNRFRGTLQSHVEKLQSWSWNFGETPAFRYKLDKLGYIDIRDGRILVNKCLGYDEEIIDQAFDEYNLLQLIKRRTTYDFREL